MCSDGFAGSALDDDFDHSNTSPNNTHIQPANKQAEQLQLCSQPATGHCHIGTLTFIAGLDLLYGSEGMPAYCKVMQKYLSEKKSQRYWGFSCIEELSVPSQKGFSLP